jgi:hypothetical protein
MTIRIDPQEVAVIEDRTEPPIIHFVGSIPLPDAETVFRSLTQTTGPYLHRLPDGDDEFGAAGIRLKPVAAIAHQYGEQFRCAPGESKPADQIRLRSVEPARLRTKRGRPHGLRCSCAPTGPGADGFR